jgi:hypothetical protein
VSKSPSENSSSLLDLLIQAQTELKQLRLQHAMQAEELKQLRYVLVVVAVVLEVPPSVNGPKQKLTASNASI